MPAQILPRYPVVRIYQQSAVIYEITEFPPKRSDKQKANQKHLTRGKYNGYLSSKSKSKIKKFLSTWLNGVSELRKSRTRTKLPKIPFITFVTLTLSAKQMHTDQEIRRKMLQPFIQELERVHNVWHHFYISEAQKNGNIHFHILIDSAIPWKAIRALWNRKQEQYGYIDLFEKRFGHRDPNSTDIHRLEKIHSVENYVMKYMTKDETKRKINGKLWGASDAIRKLKPYEQFIEADAAEFVREICSYDEFRIFRDETVTVVIGDMQRFTELRYPFLNQKIKQHWIKSVTDIYKIHPEILTQIKKANEEKEIREEKEISAKSIIQNSIINQNQKLCNSQTEISCPF
jgi:hypothetical protein